MWHESTSISTNTIEKNHIIIHFNKYSKNSWHITKILKFGFGVYSINRFLFVCSLPWIHLLKYCVL